ISMTQDSLLAWAIPGCAAMVLAQRLPLVANICHGHARGKMAATLLLAQLLSSRIRPAPADPPMATQVARSRVAAINRDRAKRYFLSFLPSSFFFLSSFFSSSFDAFEGSMRFTATKRKSPPRSISNRSGFLEE